MTFDPPLTFERIDDKPNETSTFRLLGPLTVRNIFEFQTALRAEPLPRLTVVDLAQVPFMDSAGIGVIINGYVHCRKAGVELAVEGVNYRVMELFKLTHVDKLIPIRSAVEGA
ncbi:MAG TPA: STAS domain-containing protein [Terracidiphilus sp.]|nr:STAS domain-containing protein [Terracidiphilus sp.]